MILIVNFSIILLFIAFCFLLFLFRITFENYFLLSLLRIAFYFFFLELLFRITFYFLFSELLFTFLYLCPIPSVYSNQQSTAFATIVSEALLCLCRGANIYNSFWSVTEFQGTYHSFLYFLTFLSFLYGFFILLVREKHWKTLYRFLL